MRARTISIAERPTPAPEPAPTAERPTPTSEPAPTAERPTTTPAPEPTHRRAGAGRAVGRVRALAGAGRVRALAGWLTRDWATSEQGRLPVEAIVLRAFGAGMLIFLLAESFASRPQPGLHGRDLEVLLATVALVVGALDALRTRGGAPGGYRQRAASSRETVRQGRCALDLLLVTAASAALALVAPNGVWESGPVYVAIIAAAQLGRQLGVAILIVAIATLVGVCEIAGHGDSALSVLIATVPWFLMMRLARAFREQRDELAASRAAQAQAAAAAERGRIAREMHDVLAHSLSALALTLESARLLAFDRGADAELRGALDRAHHLAATGLQEARRAVAAARGEELPGPERLPLLVQAFAKQSGLEVDLKISGEAPRLAPDAGLALYRTAQEALTNVRRHACARRVEVSLSYEDAAAVLTVADHGDTRASTSPTAGHGGYGLTGMRERAALLGGELSAKPTADGFCVRLSLPVGEGNPGGSRPASR
jgi:signal transduction histidine kinase